MAFQKLSTARFGIKLNFTSPLAVIILPTLNEPPILVLSAIPTPPATFSTPVDVLVELVVPVIFVSLNRPCGSKTVSIPCIVPSEFP